jgi:hypothetical protein
MRELLFDGSIVFAALLILQTWLLAKKRFASWPLAIFILVLSIPYDAITSQSGYVVSALVSLAISLQASRGGTAMTREFGQGLDEPEDRSISEGLIPILVFGLMVQQSNPRDLAADWRTCHLRFLPCVWTLRT